MTPPDDVLKFASQFRNTVIARARGHVAGEQVDDVAFREEAFTELFIEALAEIGAVSEGHVSHFERKIGQGLARVDGYYIDDDEDEERLDLFISIYDGGDALVSISRQELERAVKQVLRFLEAAMRGVLSGMEPADDAYSMVQRIHEVRHKIKELRIFVLTDGLAKEFRASKGLKLPKKHTVHVWDIERLSRCFASGGVRESVEVDFLEEFGSPIPCLPVKIEGASYQSYMAIFPGEILHNLYENYGERLLELNVRSFLQARGKINKEIRNTILEEPSQFFAYNNGITAIAEKVRTQRLDDGGVGLSWIRGLQIVNGGQTTASIHRAAKKDRALDQLRSISVQAKISVIEPDMIDEMVPRISRYANCQNKVTEADFSANDPFHQELERLSRSIWTPDGHTHWFYERARGQYQVARVREGRTPAAIKKFDAINPASQVFSKTDLATFEHSWAQLPHLVSRGSQKNFREFTIRLAESSPVPDDTYFRELVAKGILFKHTQRAARETQIGAYRANIVTYTVSYLAGRLGSEINMKAIWDRQAVPQELDSVIRALLIPIGNMIIETAGQRNVTEWCKRTECWTAIVSRDLMDEIVPISGTKRPSRKVPHRSADGNLREA